MSRILLPLLDNLDAPGGVARYIRALLKTFPAVETIDFVERMPSWSQVLRQLLKKGMGEAEIWVHHLFPVGTAAMLHHLKTGANYVIFLHGMDFDLAQRTGLRRFLARRILREAKAVIVNSEALKNEVEDYVKVTPHIVYPCVSDALVEEGKQDLKPVVDRVITFLTVSRLVERKGHLKVLEALKSLKEKGYSARYVIVGSGPMQQKILDRVIELGLREEVTLCSRVSDAELPEIYRNADIFIMPTSKHSSDREGFGIVYLEAGLFGLPAIATDYPGVDEAILQEKTGILVKDNLRALEDAMKRLIVHPEERISMGKEAKERVLREFTREKQMEKLRFLLRS